MEKINLSTTSRVKGISYRNWVRLYRRFCHIPLQEKNLKLMYEKGKSISDAIREASEKYLKKRTGSIYNSSIPEMEEI